MARRTTTAPPPDGEGGRILDIDVAAEMETSFLEYAYSVIYSRALPDARDGLKPVQRRILFQMTEMGLRPDRNHVKSGRVVGDVMGKLHPHGDGSIYDTLVRMAQPFAMRLPLVDGHGNFGSLDYGPAAYRYTEARLAPAALLMTDGLDEEVVDFVPSYDGAMLQPSVLPAAFPNLLVNGTTGIAVGMATNMAPHNLVEVIGAVRHLIAHPEAGLDELMRFVPGPDLPTGGKIVGLGGVREAYATGRGTFRTRATVRVEALTPRRQGLVVTELPYLVGPEKVTEMIKEAVQAKKLQGIAAVNDYSDLAHGLRLVIELRSGFNPDAVLEQLYRLTPLEDSFGINNVALVDGRPRTMGLRELMQVYIAHRLVVVRRRTTYRLAKREEELHLLEGLIIAILDIDEVIQLIRRSDDTEAARRGLMDVFDLSEAQAAHILELRLRRLTRLSRLELETKRDELRRDIDQLRELLADEELLRTTVSAELASVAQTYGTPRRTVLLEGSGAVAKTSAPMEVTDDPCWVLLSSTGLLARVTIAGSGAPGSDSGSDPADDPGVGAPGVETAAPVTAGRPSVNAPEARAAHDVLRSAARSTVRGELALVTSLGRMIRLGVLDVPAMPLTAGALSLSGGAPVSELVELESGERPLALATLDPGAPGLAIGTAQGVVKRLQPEVPGRESWEVIALRPGDEVVGAAVSDDSDELVFVTDDAQLLRFPADRVRPQGRAAGGMSGVRLDGGRRATFFGVVAASAPQPVVVTIAGTSAALPGTQPGSAKVTPLAEYPGKGRGTGGVRCHRFLRGEDTLLLAWVGAGPARAAAASGAPVALPAADGRRDGSGTPLPQPVDAIAGPSLG